MGLFSSTGGETKYGVIVDIGSGSVLAAIVESNPNKNYPNIIWAKREYAPLKQVDSLSTSVKNVMTSLASVMMVLDSEGRKALREKFPGAKLTHMQVTIAAPWSYTVAKTISYQNDNSFTITKPFVSELLRMSQQKVQEELEENERIHELGLTLISRVTADVVANGYSITVTGKQKSNSIKVIELSAITQEGIDKEVNEIRNQLLPKAKLQQFSFMMAFFYTVLDLYDDITDCCLVDITYEATEIGVVRDGVLQYCTHTPYGSISLAREISAILSVPLEEAYGYLRSDNLKMALGKHSERQKKEIEQLFSAYEAKLVDLFHETGDKLSIPKVLFMHSSLDMTNLFKEKLTNAAKEATSSSHLVYDVTTDVMNQYYEESVQEDVKKSGHDTAMLVSAQFFHKRNYELRFEQL